MLTDWRWLCNVLDNVCTGSPSRATLHLVLLLPPSSRVGSPLALMAHQADKHSPRTAPTSTRTEDIAYVKKLFLEFWNLGIRIVMEFQLCLDITSSANTEFTANVETVVNMDHGHWST